MAQKWNRTLFAFVSFVSLSCGGDEQTSVQHTTNEHGSSLSTEQRLNSEFEEDHTGIEAKSKGKELCESCSEDGDCALELSCVKGPDGNPFCSSFCSLSENNCMPGYTCGSTGSTSQDFHCLPDYGACEGDGKACSPCKISDDCVDGLVCHQSSVDMARACFTECSTTDDCKEGDATGHVCVDGICVKEYAEQVLDVCNEGGRGLCEPCAFDFDCSGDLICQDGFCSMTCVQTGGTTSTCPEGMFCPQGICQPPGSYQCQGWYSCSFGCNTSKGEVCVKGFCLIPCVEGCPFSMQCAEDGQYCEEKSR